MEEDNIFVKTPENTFEMRWPEKSCFAGQFFLSPRHPVRIPQLFRNSPRYRRHVASIDKKGPLSEASSHILTRSACMRTFGSLPARLCVIPLLIHSIHSFLYREQTCNGDKTSSLLVRMIFLLSVGYKLNKTVNRTDDSSMKRACHRSIGARMMDLNFPDLYLRFHWKGEEFQEGGWCGGNLRRFENGGEMSSLRDDVVYPSKREQIGDKLETASLVVNYHLLIMPILAGLQKLKEICQS